MTIQEFYTSIGVDYHEVESRIGNLAIARKYLFYLKEEDTYQQLQEAVFQKNLKDTFYYVHTLKGVALNLSLGPLVEVTEEMTELARAGKAEETFAVFPKVTAVYGRILSEIKKIS